MVKYFLMNNVSDYQIERLKNSPTLFRILI